MVTLEALASGIPVLGTAIGGTKELLEKLDKDLLLLGTDSNSISEHMLRFVDSHDYSNLSGKCRKFAEEYSWDNIVSKAEKVLYEAIA